MSKNLNQVPTAAATLLATDKMYIARSPFGVTDDRYILGSSLIAQFGSSPLTTKGDLYTFTTVDARLPVGTIDGQIVQVNAAAATGLAWSTATYPSTTTINQILYSNAANVVTGITTGNNGVLITSAGGVPSIGSTLPAAVQGNITALGTIATGVWHGSVIDVLYGGTGVASFTTYMPICGGTSGTGALQSVSTAGAVAGYALTYVSSSALPTWQAVGAPYTPSALTRTDDTNVTITLGGSPTTALLAATSLTMGWTGQLSLARGGTNANLTASAGGLVYSGASSLAILAGTATANQVPLSGSSAAPSWSTATYLPTLTANGILYASASNVMAQIATGNDGVLVTSAGGVPSISSTLPNAVQDNITRTGTITSGTWNGNVIGLAYGGTNANLTASNGGIFYSTATAGAILSGTATAGQMLQSGSTAAPSWSTTTWPATSTANRLLYSTFNNTIGELTSANNAYLVTNGSGVPSWSTSKPITQVNVQTITATGAFTYTPTSGTQYAVFKLQAGGGGCGGTTGTAGQAAASGGGAAGGYIELLVSGTTNLAAITGSVGVGGSAGSSGNNAGGAGGNTTLVVNSGTTWTATGGSGGGGKTSSAAYQLSGTPGATVTNTTGTNGTLVLNLPGQGASPGFDDGSAGLVAIPSYGGNSQLGRAGSGALSSTGIAGINYGGGATGSYNATAANAGGAAGAQGVVVVTEYISI